MSSGKSPASMFLSMWSNREEPAPQPDDEGQMVGDDYVLGKQIGFGGFSTVKEAYKAEKHGETKTLAVKIVKKQIAGRSEQENDEVQAEFDHEVRVWRYLSHPNVLTLDAVYETDYATFCFTKLAIGGTLFDLVRQNRSGLGTNLAKKYSYQLACAIRYLHEDARVVHRDIKLENCLLDPTAVDDGTTSSTLVLCDFGMAEWMSIDNGGDSPDPYEDAADRPPPQQMGPAGSSTSVAGSLEYASPELLQSVDGVIHPSVDVWAFGVIVYTVVVGSRPFQDSFAPRIQANIISGTWDQNAVIGDATDDHLRQDREQALELIRGCLEMNPAKRWTIGKVLECSWLREIAETVETSPDTLWKL
jgi:serine/threonine protein kinase